MALLILGIILLVLKLADFGAVGAWPWWMVLLPFGLATAWWGVADSIGLTQRRAMDKMDKAKAERRDRNLLALGLSTGRPGAARRAAPVAPAGAGRRAARDPTTADEPGRR
jgi:small Trp-rich protein